MTESIPTETGLIDALHNIPILSFFTGAGFLDIGFMQAGFNIVWHNECDKAFADGFEYGMQSLFRGKCNEAVKIQNKSSIEDLDARTILQEAFHGTQKPQTFGIIGGPPCPDFSNGGRNKGKDGRNGFLSKVYVDRLMELEPAFFLFENVPGLLKTDKHKLFLVELMTKLSDQFQLDINLLNALDIGSPQDRKRLFLIGFSKSWLREQHGLVFSQHHGSWLSLLDDIKKIDNENSTGITKLPPIEHHWFPWPYNTKYNGAKTKYNWPSKVPFGSQVPKPKDIPDELMISTWIPDELVNLPNGQEYFEPYSNKFVLIAEGDVSGKSFKRLHRWRYSPPSAYGNNEVHLHPTQPRRLTVREALRIQTVPDGYILPANMTLSKKFKTISNGVPVKLALCVAQSICRALNGELKFRNPMTQ